MKNKLKCLLVLLTLSSNFLKLYSQDSLLTKAIIANKFDFNHNNSAGFQGGGWDSIVAEASRSQYFLVGEVHGVNEVPLFINALTKQVSFQTFVAEIDPLLTTILTNKIKKLSAAQLQEWYQQYGSNLSFYSYQKDFSLLKDFSTKGISVIGIDQITALNDIPVYVYLSGITTDARRKQVYATMAKTAQEMFSQFVLDQKKLPYLMSPQFETDIEGLEKQKLSAKEQDIIKKLQYSRQIYTTRDGHQRRIKLMKNQLMEQYEKSLLNKRAIFRFGANHSSKGESFLRIYDIGNLMHNLAESQLGSSYHVAIFAKSGEAGNPLKENADMKVEQSKDMALFYEHAAADKWTYYNLKPLRKQLEAEKLELKNEFLKRLIKGYDGLVIIPKATAARHVD